MGKTPSVTGDAINVARFKTLVQKTVTAGQKYQPANKLIQSAELTKFMAGADTLMKAAGAAGKAHSVEAAKRRNTFEPGKKLSTRILNAFKTSDVIDGIIDQASSINAKIQGPRSKRKTDDEQTPEGGGDKETISASQQSMEDMTAHWEEWVNLATNEPNYAPNETDIDLNGIKAFHASLVAANDACRPLYSAYEDALNKRDAMLYAPKIGLVDRAQLIKKYMVQVFGFDSPEAKACMAIKFTRKSKKAKKKKKITVK